MVSDKHRQSKKSNIKKEKFQSKKTIVKVDSFLLGRLDECFRFRRFEELGGSSATPDLAKHRHPGLFFIFFCFYFCFCFEQKKESRLLPKMDNY